MLPGDGVPYAAPLLLGVGKQIHVLLARLLVHLQLEDVRAERGDQHLNVGAVGRSIRTLVAGHGAQIKTLITYNNRCNES